MHVITRSASLFLLYGNNNHRIATEPKQQKQSTICFMEVIPSHDTVAEVYVSPPDTNQ